MNSFCDREANFLNSKDLNTEDMVASPPNPTHPFLRSILNALPQPVFIKDSRHIWVEVNEAFAKLIGYPKEFIVGKSDYDLFPKTQADLDWEQDNRVFTAGQAQQQQAHLTHANGTVYQLSLHKSVIRDELGKPYLVGVIQQSVQCPANELEADRQEPPGLTDLPTIPDLCLRVQADGHCIYCTVPTATGPISALPAITQLAQILSPETLQNQLQRIQQVLATGERQVCELQLESEGQCYYGEMQIIPFWYDEVLMIFREAVAPPPTVLPSAQSQPECLLVPTPHQGLSDLKAKFLAMVSHEFRTPVTTIRTAVDLLKSFDLSVDEREELFQQIYGALEQAIQMMEDVLFIGRSETAPIQLDPSWFDLGQVCREVITAAEINTGRCIQLELQQAESCDRVYLDAKLVRQVVSNLVANAIKYSSAAHPIQITLIGTPHSVTLLVQDQGIGIPCEEQHQLFDFFYRASNVGHIAGTGVGLAIVKHCVDLQGGTITVESEVGKGTLFKVMLPTTVTAIRELPDDEC